MPDIGTLYHYGGCSLVTRASRRTIARRARRRKRAEARKVLIALSHGLDNNAA